MSNKIQPREHVIKICQEFDNKELKLSIIVNDYFLTNKVPKSKRPEITFLVHEIIRKKKYLDFLINQTFNGDYFKSNSFLKNTLRLGVYEIIYRPHIPDFAVVNEAVGIIKKKLGKSPSGLVNAILRKIKKLDNSIDKSLNEKLSIDELSNILSHPKWILKKWKKNFGWAKMIALCDWNNKIPDLTLRINTNKIDIDSFKDFLVMNKIPFKQSSILREFFIVKNASVLRNSSMFQQGFFSFQDISSGLISNLVDIKMNDSFIDVCASPGGKCSFIAEKTKNKLLINAFDIHSNRIKLLNETINRLDIKSVTISKKDASCDSFPISNKMLIDVPCTGTGVMSKRADLRWRRKHFHLNELVEIQKKILENMSKYIRIGGEIIYSTCSLEKEENWDIIDDFLSKKNNFKFISSKNFVPSIFLDERGALSTFPSIHKIDGVFGVKLKRIL